jgi:hypothetical protein
MASATQTVSSNTEEAANKLTYGMVQMTLKVGVTTQAEILETFGGPNITTTDANGGEMWVYDRHATVTTDKSGGFSIGLGLAGGSEVGVASGLGFGKRESKSETFSKSMTIIIKFRQDKVVSDFRSRSSSF